MIPMGGTLVVRHELTFLPMASQIVPAYGYAYFAPSIIKGYGYGAIETQLHSVPPWAAAFGLAMLIAVLSDWTKMRMPFAIFSICVCITGFGILIGVHDNTRLQYAALFLVAMGAYSAMPVVVRIPLTITPYEPQMRHVLILLACLRSAGST